VSLSLFALSLKASPFTVGLILSLLALLPTLFSVHAGRVIDRIGVRRPQLAGTASAICGIALAFLVPRLETLFMVNHRIHRIGSWKRSATGSGGPEGAMTAETAEPGTTSTGKPKLTGTLAPVEWARQAGSHDP